MKRIFSFPFSGLGKSPKKDAKKVKDSKKELKNETVLLEINRIKNDLEIPV